MTLSKLTGAIDIGGTKILVGLIAQSGEMLARRRIETLAEQGVENIIIRTVLVLDALLQEIGASKDDLEVIGCSIPGPLDSKSGVVHFSPNLGWRDIPFVDLLQRKVNVPVVIEDDANCAALGEAWMGAARGKDYAVYITISTGIGAGVIIGGNLYRGAHGFAGEIGHITMQPGGPPCSCGNYGCFEAIASGSAIAARASQAVIHGDETVLSAFNDDPTKLCAEHVVQAADSGDAVAIRIIESAGYSVGIGLAAVACAFDPEVIVVGGGVVLSGSALLEHAQKSFKEHTISPLHSLISIVPAALGEDSSLWGAASLPIAMKG